MQYARRPSRKCGATARWLYRFVGEHAPTAKVPCLIAYARVNRPTWSDLAGGPFVGKGLLARGEDVHPGLGRYPATLRPLPDADDYINRFIAVQSTIRDA